MFLICLMVALMNGLNSELHFFKKKLFSSNTLQNAGFYPILFNCLIVLDVSWDEIFIYFRLFILNVPLSGCCIIIGESYVKLSLLLLHAVFYCCCCCYCCIGDIIGYHISIIGRFLLFALFNKYQLIFISHINRIHAALSLSCVVIPLTDFHVKFVSGLRKMLNSSDIEFRSQLLFLVLFQDFLCCSNILIFWNVLSYFLLQFCLKCHCFELMYW